MVTDSYGKADDSDSEEEEDEEDDDDDDESDEHHEGDESFEGCYDHAVTHDKDSSDEEVKMGGAGMGGGAGKAGRR